jgi:hypothetical protein
MTCGGLRAPAHSAGTAGLATVALPLGPRRGWLIQRLIAILELEGGTG